ncbi:MAG: 4,5-DOPA dioxygenase extradiol [Candidatus Peregrinibacteria bacterium]|nr:4,5-DOPA dioxygenase extradiol [Candidatus Peregrinibacteria bacterium]
MTQKHIQDAKSVVKKLQEGSRTERMPLLFIGHGNPMNAIEDNEYSRNWEKVGKDIPKPKAIICMSAHWTTKGSFVTAMETPPTIHDFYGFPQELYQVTYPAKGDPKLANDMCKIVKDIMLDEDEWGLDHGAWSVLHKMYPKADIPVLQLSVDYSRSPEQQYELTKELVSLREKGILFLGSGNIVHNLSMASFDTKKPYDWAVEFDALSRDLIEKGDHKALIHYEKLGAAAKMAIPTDEHYRPLLTTLALRGEDEKVEFFNEGIDLASVSMRSCIFR